MSNAGSGGQGTVDVEGHMRVSPASVGSAFTPVAGDEPAPEPTCGSLMFAPQHIDPFRTDSLVPISNYDRISVSVLASLRLGTDKTDAWLYVSLVWDFAHGRSTNE